MWEKSVNVLVVVYHIWTSCITLICIRFFLFGFVSLKNGLFFSLIYWKDLSVVEYQTVTNSCFSVRKLPFLLKFIWIAFFYIILKHDCYLIIISKYNNLHDLKCSSPWTTRTCIVILDVKHLSIWINYLQF